MMMPERWAAPAKLNLLLKVVGRREDGYHLLQTVFQFLDWCDWITFEPEPTGIVTLAKPLCGVAEAEDLTVRAARLLLAETDVRAGVRIGVEKNLPMGGGLGGGSSDAATTLVALNALWGLGLSKADLMRLALRLGADVPVFVFGHAAWAEGVGELLTEIKPDECWAVVLRPACHIDTGEVFRSDLLTRNSKPVTITDFSEGLADNDCLPAVKVLYPEVAKAMSVLSRYGESRLTGTGSCVFVLFPEKEKAAQAFQELRAQWNVCLVKTLNCSPLYSAI
ncbi:MAG: 4-(cytidine 5'-diphospho)-2-C-methyl-D-erythritol kinase [Methylococcales bacterium]|nr:4-(cytidine 5'-diphospho)-2-C-methyl-D-erythritol kinase [Methylococcales bacterium]